MGIDAKRGGCIRMPEPTGDRFYWDSGHQHACRCEVAEVMEPNVGDANPLAKADKGEGHPPWTPCHASLRRVREHEGRSGEWDIKGGCPFDVTGMLPGKGSPGSWVEGDLPTGVGLGVLLYKGVGAAINDGS